MSVYEWEDALTDVRRGRTGMADKIAWMIKDYIMKVHGSNVVMATDYKKHIDERDIWVEEVLIALTLEDLKTVSADKRDTHQRYDRGPPIRGRCRAELATRGRTMIGMPLKREMITKRKETYPKVMRCIVLTMRRGGLVDGKDEC